jgi:MFS family permease
MTRQIGTDAPTSARTSGRRAAFASFIGSAIEYYDFYIYGMAAALVFPRVFFPNLSPGLAAISSFGTFAVAFVFRPLGSVFFGHFGDRLGRKKTLVATLLIMGLSTIAIGLLPGADTLGAMAPTILILLRALQGFAVGGEWAGAALLTAEYAPPARRGAYSVFPQIGVGTGLVTASLVFFVISTTFGAGEAMLGWAWRIAFLFSIVLVLVALYTRLKVDETPVFKTRSSATSRSPFRQVLRQQPDRVLLASGAMVSIFTFTFMGGTYLTGYGRSHLGHSYSLVLVANLVGGVCMVACCICSARLSDRFGRRTVILAGLVISVPWTPAILPLLNTGNRALFVFVIGVTFAVMAISYGPMAAFVPELFTTGHRYTGASLAYNLAGVVGGALPPVIAGYLLSQFGSWTIAVLLIVSVAISLASVLWLPETSNTTLTAPDEYDPFALPKE